MKDTSKAKQSLALLGALVMLVSMVAVGFAGSAAASTSTIDNVTVQNDPVNVGGTVTQTIDLTKIQNDDSDGTVTITAASVTGDEFDSGNFDFNNPSVNQVSNHYDGETTLSASDIAFTDTSDGDGVFTIDLQNNAQNESVDLTVDVELEVSSYGVTGAADEVKVQADTDGTDTVTDTFNLVPAQPELTVSGTSAAQPDLITVSTSNSENIEVGSVENPEDAFTLDSAGFDQATTVTDVVDQTTAVDGTTVGGAVDEVVVVLDNPVTSNASDPITEALSYDGSAAVVNSQNTNVNANSTGTALDVPTGVAPTFISANVGESVDTSVVDADNQNRVVDVVFSEDVAAKNSPSALAGEFTWGGTQSVNTSSDAATNVAGNVVTLTLDAAVAPDEDTTSTNSDLSAGTLNNQLQSATGSSTTDAATFSGQAVENNVAPVVQDSSTEVTAASPDQLKVAFNGNVQKVSGVSDAQVADAFSITGDASVDSYSGITGNVVTLNLDPIQPAGDAETVSYSASTDVIESAAANNPTPANASDGEVTNNAAPVSDSATLNSDRDQITISFSEAVTFADDVNPDVIATDDFAFTGADAGGAPAIYQGSTDANGNVLLTLDGTLSDDAEVSVDYTNNNDAIISESTGADPVQDFSETVGNNNLISSADVSYTTNPDDVGGTYTATVTFAQDITQVGTDSEVASAFDIGSAEASISSSGDDVSVDEANNQITFTVTEDGNIDSGTDFTKSSNNELVYTASAGNDALNASGSALSDFSTTLANNVVPVIDAEANPATDLSPDPAHLKVEDDSRNQLVVYFSENVDAQDSADGSNAFGFTGADAPTITNLEDSDDAWGGPTNAVRLTFDSDVAPDDNLGALTYDGSSVVNSAADSTAAQEPDIDLTVAKGFGTAPAIQEVVFDDVSENTNGDTTGEMLLYFNSDVNAQRDAGDDTTGLTFNSDSTDVSINVDGAIKDDYNEQPDNVVAVKFSSASGSTDSLVREGDTFGSNAELVVDPGSGLDITYDGTGNNIASTNVQAENIHNEIAGDLSEVSETSSDIEILGADVDEQGGTYDVTVSGLSDGDHQVLDEKITVNVAGTSTDVSAATVESEFRFDDEYNVSLPSDASVNTNIGETVSINVTNATGTELTPNTAAQVDIVHEARTTSASTSGTFIISQPQPGELVADSGIGAITSYNASSGEMENYVNMDATDRVHRGIFIDGNGTGNVYGFAYETESANVGGTTAEMPAGWNVVGSNAALSDTFPNTYDEDLRFDTSPAASSDDVRIFATDSVDTNNVGTTIQSAVNHDTSGVSEYDGYYVYMHESNDRVIIEPGYSSGDATGSVA